MRDHGTLTAPTIVATTSARHNELVIDQHAEEAAFRWTQRDAAAVAPHYSLQDLVNLDEVVEAHLEGLRLAGDAGWRACLDTGLDDAGEIFAATVLAAEAASVERVQAVLDAASDPELLRGMVSACGWLPWSAVRSTFGHLAGSESVAARYCAVGASAVDRTHPGPLMDQALIDPAPSVRARALRAAGELGLTNQLPTVVAAKAQIDPECRFWALWSAVRLGHRDPATLGALSSLAIDGPARHRRRALDMALRCAEPADVCGWCREVASQPELAWFLVVGAATGVVDLVEDLITLMADDDLARPAGEAFSMLTGVDLEEADLDRRRDEVDEEPPGGEQDTLDAPPDDPDEDLPWPDPERVAQWWNEHRQQYRAGQRYLRGKPMTDDGLYDALLWGKQRQRAAAALQLALGNPNDALFEVRARGGVQRARLRR